MTTALSTDTRAETATRTPQRCGHSAHNRGMSQNHGKGPATHYALAIHICGDGPPTLYPACAEWVAYVQAKHDDNWICQTCAVMDVGHNMCVIIGPIT